MAESSPSTPSVAPWDARSENRAQHRFRRLLPWLGLLLLVALLVWGLWPKPIVVETAQVKSGPLTVTITEEGKTRIRNRYQVSAPLAGNLRRVQLKPGDPVLAGETLLFVIDPSAAPIIDARTRLQTEALISRHEASRLQAQEALTAARAAQDLAVTERDRIRSIRLEGGIAAADRDRAEADAAIRTADLRAAEFALQVIDFEIAQAKASLARPDSANPTDAVEITAPVSGCVLQLMQESATVVSSGMVILEIGDPGDLEIETEILSRDAVTIQPGDSVEIHQWGGDESLKARVRRIEPAAFTKISALGVEEQRVIVLCDLVDPSSEAMRLGDRFRVETQIAIWHDEDVLQAPAGALFRRNNRWHSFVHRGKRAILVEIEAGSSNGRFTQVISGLVQGDQVLLHPPDTVVDGTRITIQD